MMKLIEFGSKVEKAHQNNVNNSYFVNCILITPNFVFKTIKSEMNKTHTRIS